MITLCDYQEKAVASLKTGSILNGGVGSGKSITALEYYKRVECSNYTATNMPALYIITTGKKRDDLEWEKECAHVGLSTNAALSINPVNIDSWNNITKYAKVTNAFFILDEQRVIGSGSWTKSFLKIAKNNRWLLLTGTPGDVWGDYIPVFLANGFYKNRTEFLEKHAVFNRFTTYPKIDKYIGVHKLELLKKQITVNMDFDRHTTRWPFCVNTKYDQQLYDVVTKKRWNPYTDSPIKNASELCYTARKVVNSDPSVMDSLLKILMVHPRTIIFYNFDYELDILRSLINTHPVTEYNGHKHNALPTTEKWVHLVQYTAGAEGWNCISTDAIIFYSLNYSYRNMEQAAGRIDRMNTPYTDLYYYIMTNDSSINKAVIKSLSEKRRFNVNEF